MKRLLLVSSMLLLSLRAQDPAEILRRSVELDQKDNERLKDYTYIRISEFKNDQNRADVASNRTSDVTMLAGRPYVRLIALNGKPLSEKQARIEQEKMDREFAKRRHESASDKAKREKRDAQDRKFLLQAPDAYTLRLEGVEQISGKPAWVISGEPKPGFHPQGSGIETQILKKVRGKVWIDQAEYRWVRVEAEVLEALTFALSVFRIGPGARFESEQTRVNEEVWLPSHTSIRGDVRMGFIKGHWEQETSYRDYKKFQSDSRVLLDEKPPDGKRK
jgi:hypothetical protein